MDPSAYRSLTTKRGLKYNYFVVHGTDSAKPALLFIHGFPSTSYDWRHQVPFFRAHGFTVIVPDMLGYGGTDKPTEVEKYKFSGMAADMIDILDAENVAPGRAVAIGHDWGSGLTCRIANYYPERFLGFAFLSVGYSPPSTSGTFTHFLDHLKGLFGYELFGYWLFFSEEGADKIIEEHWDSFINIVYPSDPAYWRTDLAPVGALKAWVLADRALPPVSYLTEADKKHMKESIRDLGIAGPLNWYKVMTSGLSAEDNKQIPQERYTVQQPTFFGAAMRDYVCVPELFAKALCPNLTWRGFDADHWVQLAQPDELNRELLAWIDGIREVQPARM
ncbi:Alpha/Beta hydrolase protein [Sparassis latifolia]